MKIAVVGTGSMGSVYAGLLADAGNEVWAIDAWPEHVDAINERGLRVEGASGDRTVAISASTDARDAGVCDLVIIATKAMDVEAAARAAEAIVGPDTAVLSIQNGLGGPDTAAAVLGEEAVMVGVVGGFGAALLGPGHVRHEGMELVRLGERRGPLSERVERVAGVWREAGFTVRTFDDVAKLVWEKLVCNVAFSATCTILELTIGEVLAHETGRELATSCAAEAHSIGLANGVEFDFDDPRRYVVEFGEKIPDARPSMLLDYLAGRPGEIDVINGSIPRVAASLGLEAPVNATVSALVRTKERCMLAQAGAGAPA